MAFTGITATEAEIDQKTGANVSAAFTDVMKTAALLQAESVVNGFARYNFSDNWGTLNVDVKYLITNITASMVAIEGIGYDLDTYGRTVAEDKITILTNDVQRNLSILKDKKVQDFVNGA